MKKCICLSLNNGVVVGWQGEAFALFSAFSLLLSFFFFFLFLQLQLLLLLLLFVFVIVLQRPQARKLF